MIYSDRQLKWIKDNSQMIENRDFMGLRESIFLEDLEAFEKRQLFAGLAIVLDLPLEILRTKKKNSRFDYYPLYINMVGRLKLVEYQCMGNPGETTIKQELFKLLISNWIDGEIAKELIKRAKYDVVTN